MKFRLHIKSLLSSFIIRLSIATALCLSFPSVTPVYADEKSDLGEEITTLYRSARKVISANQKLINEQGSGKSFTAAYVIEQSKKNFKEASGKELDLRSDPHKAKSTMLSSVTEVMNSAQDLINDPEVAFKGFLPAIFARQVATTFGRRMEGRMTIKLTAPKVYVRNRANRPDRWEANIIDNMFAQADYEKGKPFFENSTVKGKPAFRYILPEYYGQSCLGCHGEPKGSIDITGGKKEGGKLNELGGAISLVIYN